MSIVKPLVDFPAFEIRGNFGLPNFLGRMVAGVSKLGDSDKMSGVYQKRPRKRGQIFVNMRHYAPTNRRTIPQQAWRTVFANAMSAWGALDAEQKKIYHKQGIKWRLDARSAFLRIYLNSHK